MLTTTSHDATGQMHGYLFQLERALYQLSQAKSGGMVGIETGDDVVVKSSDQPEAEQVLEQDKHSTSDKKPFSDLSKDLWNTLLIWSNGIKAGKVDIEKSSFLLVSNKKLPSGRFVWKINKASSEKTALTCVTELRQLGAKHKGKLKPTIQQVLANSDKELADIILKTHVLDATTHHDRNTFKKDIRDNLRMSKDIPFHETYQQLLGWLLDTVLDCWHKEREAWVTVEALNEKASDLIKRFHGKPFIEKAVNHIPIKDPQRKAQQKEPFVKQLKLVKCKEDDLLRAIDDFLRATAERTRYAEENRLTKQDFDEFENNLIERWISIFGAEEDQEKPEISGRKIYFQTTNYKEILGGVETEQYYTTKGAYHRLSNKLSLGWHPKWKELMKK